MSKPIQCFSGAVLPWRQWREWKTPLLTRNSVKQRSLTRFLYLKNFFRTQLVKGSWPRLLKAFHSQMQQENNSSNNKKKQGKGVADYPLTFHCTRFNTHRASLRFQVFPTLQNAPLLFAETGLLFGKCTCLLSAKRGRWIVSKTIQFWKSNVQQWRVIGFQRNRLMVYI